MVTRSKAQIVGTTGERLVQSMIDEHEQWMARRQTHDFGIDLEAELAPPCETGQRVSGKLIKLQVKTQQTVERKGDHVSVRIERSLLKYTDGFRLPVILTLACLDTRTVWWLWLQDWILNNEARLARNPNAEMISIRIPIGQTLDKGLKVSLPAIALGSNRSAMVLALRNIIEAASGWEDREISDGVVRILDKVYDKSRAWTLQKVIDKLLGLGSAPAFWEAQQILPVLLALIETGGDTFTADQVLRLVARDDTYSRTGLIGLSHLYDCWRSETLALDLTRKFSAAALGQVAWYTAMRERYPTEKGNVFCLHLLGLEHADLDYGGYGLTLDEDVRDHILSKWPTRGDSVLLDCLRLTAQP